jgi:hypothetical protein
VPYVAWFLASDIPRFTLYGDWAGLELAVRHVFRGDVLLGPYSRFHWNHPGPLFFYILAPFQWLVGSSRALYAGTCCINAAAAAAIPVALRIGATRAHAIAGAAIVIAWFAAFGNIAGNPWNPLVIALPLATFFLLSTLFACGKRWAAYPAVVFGAFVFQTHISAASTVLVIAVASALVFARRTRQRPPLAAALLTFVLFLPPLIEQLIAPRGNIRKLLSFFLDRTEPLQPLKRAVVDWVDASSWLPHRALDGALAAEGIFPLPMHWEPMPAKLPASAAVIAFVFIAARIAAAVFATKRKETLTLTLLGVSTAADLLVILALLSIVGADYHYLVFWTTAATTIGWLGVLAAIPDRRWLLALLVVAAGLTTARQRAWIARNSDVLPGSRPDVRADFGVVYTAMRERLAKENAIPIIHREGDWGMAAAAFVELDKDHAPALVPRIDAWNFYGVKPWDSGPGLHLWFATSRDPLELAPCLEPIAKSGDITLFASHEAVARCP